MSEKYQIEKGFEIPELQRLGMKFKTRTVEGGVRVWRVK